jgi:hypothetical protein
MARYLQNRFQHFSIFIPEACKSAGTLVAIGAHEVIIGPFGEIGPLDVQFYKVDELDVVSSGLVAESAIKSLEKTAIEMFEKYLLRLHSGSGGLMTLKTATEMAADLVAKLLNPVSSQIDPFRIGENDLMMRVAKEYGERLAKRSGNLRSRQTLKMLVEHYPSHDFVIDNHEVETIFKKVRGPDARLRQLAQALGLPQMARSYDENSHIVAMLTGRSEAGVAAAIAPADMHHGFAMLIWANQVLRASLRAMQRVAGVLKAAETTAGLEDQIAPLSEVFRLQRMDALAEAERRYLPGRDGTRRW